MEPTLPRFSKMFIGEQEHSLQLNRNIFHGTRFQLNWNIFHGTQFTAKLEHFPRNTFYN